MVWGIRFVEAWGRGGLGVNLPGVVFAALRKPTSAFSDRWAIRRSSIRVSRSRPHGRKNLEIPTKAPTS